MSSHYHLIRGFGRTANLDTTEAAVVRRADGRTLRKSCNRCHQQKSRCVGDRVSLTRCKRCQRAGLECIYEARSSKKSGQSSIDNFTSWDNWARDAADSTLSGSVSDMGTIFGIESTHFDDVFSISPSSGAATDNSNSFSVTNLSASETYARVPINSAISVPLFSPGSPPEADQGLPVDSPITSRDLTKVFQELEATFLQTVEDQTGRSAQDYPIGEVLGVLGNFLDSLKLSDWVTGPTCTTQDPQNARLRSKQASMAAQGYVLCVRLLAHLLEQLLQSLLVSPSKTSSSNSGGSDDIGDASGLRLSLMDSSSNSSNAGHVPQRLRLGDLYVPPDEFSHALNSSITILRIGCSQLEEMEQVLGITSKNRREGVSSLVDIEQTSVHRQVFAENGSSKLSLPARFVASIWEDEASIDKKSSLVYLQRFRAAILGLAELCA